MNEKTITFLQVLLQKSQEVSTRQKLKQLAQDLISEKDLNDLKQKFEKNVFEPPAIISDIINMWIKNYGRGATLTKFEQILRKHCLNPEAGKCMANENELT